MSRLQTAWGIAARDLGLDIVVPFSIPTRAGGLTAEVLLKNFGSPEGMLIVSDYTRLAPFRQEIIELGYGFATLAEPDRDWPFTDEEKEAFIEMLSDWRWSGPPGEEPDWLLPPEEETES